MKVLCTICARGGSKGIHKKNLRTIAGKPLIAHTIELAVRFKLFDAVVFSSDCSDLMEVARTYGANVFFKREKSLSSDNAGKIPVIQDAHRRSCEYFQTSFDVHFDLDCTSPLRIEHDLINAFNLFTKTDSDLTISGTKSRKSPYFNIVEVEEDGWVKLSKKSNNNIVSRQQAPQCFDLNASFYIWKKSALLESTELILPRTTIYEMPPERSIDIDDSLDLFMVEQILSGRWADWNCKPVESQN